MYLYFLSMAICCLVAVLLYVLGVIVIRTHPLLFPGTVLGIVVILLGFKAADTWSGWDNDTSEDTNVRQNRSNAYPITFYTEAALVTLTVVFLLVFTMIRNRPTIAEGSVLAFALFVAGVCTFIGRLSSHLE